MFTRRALLGSIAAGTALAVAPGLSVATAATDARLVLVLLRGAVDGLAFAPPIGDRNYRRLRGVLALEEPSEARGALDLDGFFALHPALAFTHGRFRAGEATIAHAVATPYRGRSHFDGQDVLEQGGAGVGALRDGWLNRALAISGPDADSDRAIALAQNTPLVLRGARAVSTWAPSRLPDVDDSTLERLRTIYARDEFFAERLEQALEARRLAGAMDARGGGQGATAARRLRDNLEAAAAFLSPDGGATIAVVEAGGWDTHADQGAVDGPLARQLAALDGGLEALRAGLGDVWARTAILVTTEFGRTVRVNGTRGTDHGTASAALLVGGAVAGGRVIADWPGLGDGDLFEGRDLAPTLDLRSLCKGVLVEHLGVPARRVEHAVFPDSGAAPALRNLIAG